MNLRPTILTIEPEPETRRQLGLFLTAKGFQVMEAENGRDGYAQAVFHPPDLVLMETALPDMDGNELCRQFHQQVKVPIVVLSIEHEETEIVRTLDSGADDYLTKPFLTGELLARIRVALRRNAASKSAPKSGSAIQVGPLVLDSERHIIYKNGQEVKLTVTEFRLLGYLMEHAGKLVTYPMILNEVWGSDSAGSVQALRVHINQLRKKIEIVPYQPRLILTEPHIGYRLMS